MKTLSTLLVGLALIAAPGCSRDDDGARTAPRASRSSGSGDDGARATAARTDDDADDQADEYADDSASASTSGGTASTAPPASEAPSAQDQPMATSDEDITRQIRQAVVGDDSLSIMARNATIVTRSGVVTLRGTVSEADERIAIERHARAAQGVSRVDNRIAVRD